MFLLIDKPRGLTSHDVVDRVRKITNEKRVGHAGTLDPNATGLLIVGVGRSSTKRLMEFLRLDKVYEAEITLGEERDTDDADGKITNSNIETLNKSQITKFKLQTTLNSFVGKHVQIPPVYSAIKLRGKKAYQFARKGMNISLASRKIEIYSIKLISYNFPLLKIKAKVSSGTYIRSIARDLGRKLGTFGYLSSLKRTQIGKHKLSDAVDLEILSEDDWRRYSFSL